MHARWTSLLIKSIAERDSERAASIQVALGESTKIFDAFIADPKNQAYRVWIEYSYETVRFNLTNRAVANFLAAPTNKARRDDALETLRSMLDHLVEIKEMAHTQLGTALRRSDRDSASRVRDLGSLHNRLSLLEIDCMLLRSECYPQDSDERIAAGTEALAAIDKITGRIESDWSGQELLDLTRNQSLIALSRYNDAVQSLSKWIPTVNDPSLRHRGIAMLASAYQSQGDLTLATKALLTASNNALQESPEIGLATLALQIASWKKQSDASPARRPPSVDENDQEIERILKVKNQIADRFGGYWRQRAEALIVAASLGSSAASNASVPSTSLDLLKVEIRQRLAAGDFSGAVLLLEQAEAATLASNDMKQAFVYAKSALGVAQQQNDSNQPTLSNTQSIIERIALTAKTYSAQETSAQLHQLAIERQQALIATDASTKSFGSISDAFMQMLLEHVMVWPDDESSSANRQQLQKLYFSMADIPALVALWSDELSWLTTAPKDVEPSRVMNRDSRIASACASLVNAKLLSSLVAEPRADAPSESRPTGHLPPAWQWILDALGGDFDWWKIDGGLRQADGASIVWNPPGNTIEKDDIVSAFQTLLYSAMQSEITDNSFEIQRIIDWTRTDLHGRIAWITALNLELSNILRLRSISDGHDRAAKEWLDSLTQLHAAMQEDLQALEIALHPSVFLRLNEHAAIVGARITAMNGDVALGETKIESFRQKDTRNLRWTLELARLSEMQSDRIENALQLYRQLASGSPVGSDAWFESRLSSARCLRQQKKIAEADQIVALVQAMIADVPEKWKRRLK